MKIIVNNEKEKEIIERFLSALEEHMLDVIRIEDDKYASDNNDEAYLLPEMYDFLLDGIVNCKIECDEKVSEMYTEHYNITGKCVECEKNTEGTFDGNDVSYLEYLEYYDTKSINSWKCETCYFKE